MGLLHSKWAQGSPITTVRVGVARVNFRCMTHSCAGLVDVRDRDGGDITHVAQENIVLQAAPAPILHPGVQGMFEAWAPGVGYVPTSDLQEAYPEDNMAGR